MKIIKPVQKGTLNRRSSMLSCCLILFSLNFCLAQDSATSWIIESGPIDQAAYFGEALSNGMIGIRTMPVPFRTEQTLMNGVYEEYDTSFMDGHVNTLVSGFNFLNLAFTIDGERIETVNQVKNFRQVLDLKHASFTTTFDFQDKASVTYTLRTLQHLPFTALLEVSISARRPIEIRPIAMIDPPQPSDTFSDVPTPLGDAKFYDQAAEITNAPRTELRIRAAAAKTQFGRNIVAAANGFIFDEPLQSAPRVGTEYSSGKHGLGFAKKLSQGSSYHFSLVGSTISSVHSSDPLSEAERLTTFAMIQGTKDLIDRHNSAWAALWKSDIRIAGDDEAQRRVHSMLFHLYSAIRAGAEYSIAPMGLSRSVWGYFGHIFPDAEGGMLPTLAVLHPELAKPILDYRFERLGAAKRNAAAHGYAGAMFPWESAVSGDEEAPSCTLAGPSEHSVNAAVGIAAWDYYRITQDKEWLRDRGFPLIKDTADFWASRVIRNGPGHFDINHVIGGDELVPDVNNAAAMNGGAIANLKAAVSAAKVLDIIPNPDWDLVSRNIPIFRSPDGIILQYENYQGGAVPQADANALVWPLQLLSDPAEIRRNLDYYSSRSHAISVPGIALPPLAIIHQRLGDTEQAFRIFEHGFDAVEFPPFGVIGEYPNLKNTYFYTGAGGILQILLYGFGGLDITDQGLVQHETTLPRAWKSLTLTGIGPQKASYRVTRED